MRGFACSGKGFVFATLAFSAPVITTHSYFSLEIHIQCRIIRPDPKSVQRVCNDNQAQVVQLSSADQEAEPVRRSELGEVAWLVEHDFVRCRGISDLADQRLWYWLRVRSVVGGWRGGLAGGCSVEVFPMVVK